MIRLSLKFHQDAAASESPDNNAKMLRLSLTSANALPGTVQWAAVRSSFEKYSY